MSLFRALSINKKGLIISRNFFFCNSSLEKPRSRSRSRNRSEHLSGVQQWSYYHDLAIQSGISSSSLSLYLRFSRSLYHFI